MANEIATTTVDVKVEGPRMRIEAMAFAVRSMDESPEQVVKRAEAYYEFLKGGTS